MGGCIVMFELPLYGSQNMRASLGGVSGVHQRGRGPLWDGYSSDTHRFSHSVLGLENSRIKDSEDWSGTLKGIHKSFRVNLLYMFILHIFREMYNWASVEHGDLDYSVDFLALFIHNDGWQGYPSLYHVWIVGEALPVGNYKPSTTHQQTPRLSALTRANSLPQSFFMCSSLVLHY